MTAPADPLESLMLAAEEREFKRNSHVTDEGTVVTGYGGLASFVDSDGTVYENPGTGPSPDRLARDRERGHQLRNRARNQRLVQAERRIMASRRRGGCLPPMRRQPQARRPRPAARRRTVSSRAGPDDGPGDPEPGPQGSGHLAPLLSLEGGRR